jgi:hypothetical protein
MNKLNSLYKYLKSSGLKESYAVIKLAQINDNNDVDSIEDDPYANLNFVQKIEDWMSKISSKSLITMTSNKVDLIKDFSGALNVSGKPKGIWYAKGYGWMNWLRVEMPHWLSDYNYIYELIPKYSDGLNGSGGVLQLKTEEDVLLFSKKFGVNNHYGSVDINWPEVAKFYDGIEIIPYQYSLRYNNDVSWYYGWDLGSGCIWRKAGGLEFSLIAEKPGL